MKPRYTNGRLIPEKVIGALWFVGKVGFLSKEIWHEFFGTGTFRWKEQQLQRLVERGYLKKHRNEIAKRHYVATEKTEALLLEMKFTKVSPVPVMYLTHDSVVAKSMLSLQREKLIRTFTVERELKTHGMKDFLLSDKDQDLKYPDAIMKIHAFNKDRTVAIEYEKERKSLTRYKSILFQYAGLVNVSMVVFVCETPGIESAIKSAMKYLGQTNLSDRLAFVNADEWKESPKDAPIYLSSGPIKLVQVCKKIGLEK